MAFAVGTAVAAVPSSAEPPGPVSPQLRSSTADDWKQLDWKDIGAMTPDERARVPVACCGAFIEPGPAPTAGMAAEDNILLSGDQSELTRDSTVVTGHVQLVQGSRSIHSDRAELYDQPQRAHLGGQVLLRDPGFLLQGSDLDMDIDHNQMTVKNARYVLHQQHVHGTAGEISRREDGVISLKDNTYSSCTPGDELWYLKSSWMTLDPAHGEGKAANVRLEVADIPVFYIPYLEFPIGSERRSGLLMPTFSHSRNGADTTIPYYFNLAPNYDATLIPRILSDRGTQLGGEFRYLSPLFDTVTSATWLSHDRIADTDRWLLAVRQTGGRQQPWSTRIDFTRVSDKDYFTDLDNVGLSVTRATNLTERAGATYFTDHWENDVDVLAYQSLLPGTLTSLNLYQKLPELRATGDYVFANGISADLEQGVAHFRATDSSQTGGNRLAARYRFGWRSDSEAGYIAPDVEFHFLRQQLDSLPASANQPQVTVPAADLDMGMTFEREDARNRQTLEPRLHYRYAPYRNQDDFQLFDTDEMTLDYSQLFQPDRFSGSDRIGDANQLAAGLTSRWLDQATGNEWLQAGIGQVFYHSDRRITAFTPADYALLPASYRDRYTNAQSPLLAGMQWAFRPGWQLASDLAWDEEERHTQHGNVFLHYHSDTRALFSAGYRYVELLQWTGTGYVPDTAREADLSGFWPLDNQWSLAGRALFDFTNHRYLESLAGFQYEDCCWRLRTFLRRWAINPLNTPTVLQQKTDAGIFLEIQFKNLAGTGTKTDSLLNDSIYGYREADHDSLR